MEGEESFQLLEVSPPSILLRSLSCQDHFVVFWIDLQERTAYNAGNRQAKALLVAVSSDGPREWEKARELATACHALRCVSF